MTTKRQAVISIQRVFYSLALGVTWQMALPGQLGAQVSDSNGNSITLVQPGSGAADTLTADQREALIRRHLDQRERTASQQPPPAAGPTITDAVATGRETVPSQAAMDSLEGATEFHGTPSAFLIGRNFQNTRASTAGVANTLAEPVAANDGYRVMYMGNTHNEYSLNGGSTYTAIALPPIPAGYATCCDPDIIYDQRTGSTLRLFLATTASNDNIVALTVRRNVATADNCTYWLNPGGAVAADYPHLGLTNKFAYVSMNNVSAAGAWVNSQMWRLNLDQLVDCVPAASLGFTVYTYVGAVGQKVFVPVRGTEQRDRMYWGLLETTTSLRIFRWDEAAAGPVSSLRTGLSTSTFSNPDCRGGLNNTDWLERGTSWSSGGFRLRGVLAGNEQLGAYLAFYWNTNAHAGHPQAHVHSAVFREGTLTLLAQPHIWNASLCFAYPMVNANERGDIGLSIAFGGRVGGGGGAATAVRPHVGIDDEFTAGIGFFGTVFPTATATHNPAGSAADPPRWGDYTSVNPHEPCDLWFNATGYAHNGGTGVAQVNARYVEFGRGRDSKCYNGWRTAVRVP